ncbi:caspase family protein [Chitinophaga ginsengisoli]|uniref:Caspase domain-containing protein n=1 Tax=Chitinophaga ginsengisoli TaxID=363837 RepID=A0A2P8G397_9BACT|nr:caspase family protein [Chitinophaga ginsengisoli]PSL28355.1 caspase domain-containing protein [Chitinophaga ginsengisoli]
MRKILIASGTSQYDFLLPDQQRPQIVEIVKDIKTTFSKQLKYDLELEEISINPLSNDLRMKMDDWLADPGRCADDWVVFYYTGHGEIVGGNSLYLLTRDYKTGRHTNTAVSVRQIGEMVAGITAGGAKRNTRRMLFILDTCFSGTGVENLSDVLQNTFERGNYGNMFYILAASFPEEEARAGGLSRALIAAVDEVGKKSKEQSYIYFDQIIPAIYNKLLTHKPLFVTAASPDTEQQFFPNPHYIAGIQYTTSTTTTTTTNRSILRSANPDDFKYFWEPNARGVSTNSESGWYFTGRTKMLSAIAGWLNVRSSQMLIVTGPPGSGKSTMLSMIVLLAQPQAEVPVDLKTYLPIFQQLDLAVLARGKNLQDIVQIVAQSLNIEPSLKTVIHAFESVSHYFMLLDGLDESLDKERIYNLLLAPLSKLPNVKLIIGSRPDTIWKTRADFEIISTDDGDYINQAEFEQYVLKRLVGISSDKERLQAASMITAKAYPNFLIGRLATAAFLTGDADLEVFNKQAFEYPSTVNQAFTLYLKSFNEQEKRVRDILLPLAWAQGNGIPWDQIWLTLVNVFSEIQYKDEDIRWVIENAGAFILEVLENNRSVFKLYHEAMREYLRGEISERKAHTIIVNALINTVPLLPAQENNHDWRLAHPYLLNYLPDHAAISGDLERLVIDPLFLLYANPIKLHAILLSQSNQIDPILANVYQSSIHHIRNKDLSEAAVYLKLNSWKYGQCDLIIHDAWKVLKTPWRVNWAIWNPQFSSHEIAHGKSNITAIAHGKWEGQNVVAVCRERGVVEIWNLETYDKTYEWDTSTNKGARALCFSEHDSGLLLVLAWLDGLVKTINLNSQWVNTTQSGGKVRLMEVTKRKGENVCILYQEPASLVMRTLPDLALVMQRDEIMETKAYNMDCVQLGQEKFLLTVGDHLNIEKDGSNCNIYLFSLEDFSTVWHNPSDNRGVFLDFQVLNIYNSTMAVVSQDSWGPTEIWDLKARNVLFRDEYTTAYSWISANEGKSILLSIYMGELYSSTINYDSESRSIIASDRQWYPGIRIYGNSYRVIQLSGREKLLTKDDNGTFLHLWDIASIQGSKMAFSSTQLEDDKITTIAVKLKRFSVVYGGSRSNGINLIDVSTGLVLEKFAIPLEGRITSLAITTNEEKLICVTDNSHLGLIDINQDNAKLSNYRKLFQAEFIQTIFILKRDGQQILLAAVKENHVWSVRIWNITTSEEIPANDQFRLISGQEDKTIEGLTGMVFNNKLRIAFSSKYGMVNVGDYEDIITFESYLASWYTFGNDGEYIECLVSGDWGNRKILVSASEYGHITIFNFETGQIVYELANAHPVKITALLFFDQGVNSFIISGDTAGTLKFWSVELEGFYTIELRSIILKILQGVKGGLFIHTVQGIVMINVADLFPRKC